MEQVSEFHCLYPDVGINVLDVSRNKHGILNMVKNIQKKHRNIFLDCCQTKI